MRCGFSGSYITLLLAATIILTSLNTHVIPQVSGMAWNRLSKQPSSLTVIDRLAIADWLRPSLNSPTRKQQRMGGEGGGGASSQCTDGSCASSCPSGGGSTCMGNGECVCGQMIMSVCDTGSDGNPTNDLYVTVWPPSLLRTNGAAASSSSTPPSLFWATVPPPAVNLAPRLQHTVNAVHIQTSSRDEKVILVFGGASSLEYSSLWLYDPKLNEMVGIGPAPPKQINQDNACTPDTAMWNLYNGTVDMCTRPLSYVEVPLDGSGCPWPSARMVHAAFQIKDKYYVLGGSAGFQPVFGDLWELSLDQLFVDQWQLQRNSTDGLYVKPFKPRCTVNWRLLTQPFSSNLTNAGPNTPFPAARYAASVAVLGTRVYISGGASETEGFDDIWMLDLFDTVTPGAMAWLQLRAHLVSAKSPLSPPWRRAQAALLPVYDLLIDTSTFSLVTSPSVSSTTPTMFLYVGGQDVTTQFFDRGIWVMALCSGLTINSPERSNCSDVDTYWNSLQLVGLELFPKSDDTVAAVSLFNGQFVVGGLQNNEQPVANTFRIDLFPPAGNITVYTPPATPSYVLSASYAQTLTGRLTPPNRQEFGLCTFNNIAWMIGGVNASSNPVNDGVWAYDITSDEWTQFFPSGDIPAAASRLPNSGCDESGNMWQFFGIQNIHVLIMIPDLWKYSTTTNQWSNVTALQTSSVPWKVDVNGSTDGLWAIGATYQNGFLFPILRVSASVTKYGVDEVLIYGGTYQLLSVKGADLWAFNTTRYSWRLIQAQNVSMDPGMSDQFIGRSGHVAALDDSLENFIIAFGGTSAGQLLASARRYNFRTDEWFEISDQFDGQVAPGPRFGAASAVINGALYIFGGQSVQNLRDLWRLSFTTWKWMALDIPGQSFLSPDSSHVSPSARCGASMTPLTLTNQLLLFGGSHSDPQGDLHILSLDHFQVGTGSDACTRTNAMAGVAQPMGENDVLSLMQLSPDVFNSTRGAGIPPWFASSRIASVITYSQLIASGFAELQLCPNSSETDSISNMAHRISVVTVKQPMRISGSNSDAMNRSSSGSVPSGTSIDCSRSRCLTINTGFAFAPVEFIDISFANGEADEGGSFLITNSSVTFTDCTFHRSHAQRGGAISAANAQLAINRCSFDNNRAEVLGGAVYTVFSSVILSDSSFQNNQAAGSVSSDNLEDVSMGGAAFHLSSSISAANCNWSNNTAMRGGAVLAASLISVAPSSAAFATFPFVIVGSTFVDNHAGEVGGAILLSQLFASSVIPTLINVTFIDNDATADGAGVYLDESLLSIQTSNFSFNTCGGSGGCVHWKPNSADSKLQFPPIIDDSTLQHQSNNSALYGSSQASVAVDLKLLDGSASMQLQSSGELVQPPIVLALIDAYGQIVATDNSTFVSILPVDSFDGVTTVRVVNGIANFSQLTMSVPPKLSVFANFSASILLPRLISTQASGSLTLLLTAQPCQQGQRVQGRTCENCPAGRFSNGIMSPTCPPCPPGSFSTDVGSTACTLCAIGTAWSGEGLSTDCPDCTQQFFAWTEGSPTCVECDEGLTCAAGQGTAKEGHWLLPLSVQLNGSSPFSASSFVDDAPVARTVPCPYDNCLDNSTCGINRIMPASSNPLCGACVDGHIGTESCVECRSVQWGKVFGMSILFLAFTFVLHVLAQSSSSSGYLQLLFYFVQILLLELGGTRQMGNWASWLHVLDFNPSKAGGNTCIVPTDAYQRLAVDLFTPAMLCAALLLLAIIYRALELKKADESKDSQVSAAPTAVRSGPIDGLLEEEKATPQSEVRHSDSSLTQMESGSTTVPHPSRFSVRNLKSRICAALSRISFDFISVGRTLLSIYLFSYSSVTLTVMSHLICVDVGEGRRVVYFDPVMDCHSTEFKRWWVIVIIFLIGFVILVPIVIGIHLRRLYRNGELRKHRIQSDNDLSPVIPAPASDSESRWISMEQMDPQSDHKSSKENLNTRDHALREQFLPRNNSSVFDSESDSNHSGSDQSPFLSRSITSLLVEPYRPHAYYFHAVILLRRAVFVALSTGLDSNPAAQYLAYALWNMALLCLHLYIQPYHEVEENVTETVNTFLLLLVSGLLQFTSATASSKFTSGLFPAWMQIILIVVLVLPCAHMCRRIVQSYWRRAKEMKAAATTA